MAKLVIEWSLCRRRLSSQIADSFVFSLTSEEGNNGKSTVLNETV
jgi:hypothetical protein